MLNVLPFSKGASAGRRDEQEAIMQKEYCLYSKVFNLFQLDSYFRQAALVPVAQFKAKL
jgi:hypothetical protein